MARSVEELERLLKAAEARATELQAWSDASERDAEQLRARVAELEQGGAAKTTPARGPDPRLAELQAWADSAEAEAEQLRARVAELEQGGDAKTAQLQARVAELEALQKISSPSGIRADPRVAELQAWADSAEAEAEQLRARVAELEAKQSAPARGPDPRLAELQAWADSAEAEAEQLRARVAELEALQKVSSPSAVRADPRVAELQAWADASEAEAEQLRARVAELEAGEGPRLAQLQARVVELEALQKVSSPSGVRADPRVAELQAWADASEAEAEKLRARVAELEAGGSASPSAVAKADSRLAELQAWADSAEAEAEQLRADLTEAQTETEKWKLRFEQVSEPGSAAAENRHLRERVSELESLNHSLREMNARFAEQVDGAARRQIGDLESQLAAARATGREGQVSELEALLSNAREAIATLEVERSAAVEQVRRYVGADSKSAERSRAELERKHRAELDARERRITSLEAQLAEKVDEVSVLQVRVKAWGAEEQKLQAELSHQRDRACAAEERLGHAQTERDVLAEDKAALEARSLELSRKLEEAQRWLAQAELDTAELEKKLEATRTELAVVLGPRDAAATAAAAAGSTSLPPPPPADALEEGPDGEGFSVQHMHRLEAQLAVEKLKNEALARFVETSEHSLARMQDELDAARGRLADLAARLGLSDAETGEVLDRLDATRRELHALKAELGKAQSGSAAPPADVEAAELAAEDVLDAPLDALEALSAQQQQAAREATDALAAEQRARDQNVADLTWLKGELEKLSHVRDELRHRIQAMVQRELKRKQVVGALLQKLRSTEVAAAARAGSLRRLQAAIELAQRMAVKVQTVYFQKQIGSLQRQLEVALSKRKAIPLKAVR